MGPNKFSLVKQQIPDKHFYIVHFGLKDTFRQLSNVMPYGSAGILDFGFWETNRGKLVEFGTYVVFNTDSISDTAAAHSYRADPLANKNCKIDKFVSLTRNILGIPFKVVDDEGYETVVTTYYRRGILNV